MNFRLKNSLFFNFFKVTFFMVVFLLAIFLIAKSPVRAEGLVNINTATLEELDSLPGIGPGKAQDIIDYREGPDGPFETTEEIKDVPGIGESTWNDIKDLITVGDVSGSAGDPAVTGCYTNIVINEVLPNPAGSDDSEWIELQNTGLETVDLAGYKISDATDKKFEITASKFSATILDPGGFFILPKEKTDIALNNSGTEQVKLFCPDETPIHEISYTDAIENASWSRFEDEYHWTTSLTPNAENELTEPVAESTGGGSSSSSGSSSDDKKEKNKPKYSTWHGKVFLNEVMPNPAGLDPGHEWIEISNSSTANIIIKSWKIKEDNGEHEFGHIKLKPFSYYLLYPDPETFQLDNFAGEEIVLTDSLGLEIDRLSYNQNAPAGHSLNRCQVGHTWLEDSSPMQNNLCPPVNENPRAYFDTSLSNVKVGDKITFDARESFDTDGEIVEYIWSFGKKAIETTWNFENKKFKTTKPLLEVIFTEPGQTKISLEVLDSLGGTDKFSANFQIAENQISKLEIQTESNIPKTEKENPNQGPVQMVTVQKNIFPNYNFVPLENIRQLASGQRVSTSGIVSVEPGILGVNIFYLAGSGIQVYMSSKDFPDLKTGDEIQVTGTLSEAYGEKRIKVKNKKDFQTVSRGNSCEPYQIGISELGEDDEGSLIQVSGQVTEVGHDYFYLDDQTDELKVYFKKTLDFDWLDLDLAEGDFLEVTGIFSETTSGYRLLPRYHDDLTIVQKATPKNDQKDTKGEVLGAKDGPSRFDFRDYLIAFLLFVTLALVVVILKFKREKGSILSD